MIDGAIITNIFGAGPSSASGSTLGIDGIQEFRIITNSFSAEYGMTMGSQMIIVSKGGTNSARHAFEYLRNSALDAANYFDVHCGGEFPASRIPPQQFRRLPGRSHQER